MKKFTQEKGITLIALIITIVVLIILAIVTIQAITGDGILDHARNATSSWSLAQAKEEVQMAVNQYKIESTIKGRDQVDFGNYINAILDGGISSFFETDTTWGFNYKGYGFKVNKSNLSVEGGDAIPTYKLITSADELVSGAEYIIASGKSGNVYVLDSYNPDTEEYDQKNDIRFTRNATSHKVSENSSIYYNGNYSLKISGSGDNWTIYDSTEKQYLAHDGGTESYLLNSSSEYYFSISFEENGSAVIKTENDRAIRARTQNNTMLFRTYDINSNTGTPVYLFMLNNNLEQKVLFTPTVNVKVESKKITLSWNTVYGAGDYTIEWNGATIQPPTKQTTYVFDNLNNGNEYTYRVKANKPEKDDSVKSSPYTELKIAIPGSGSYKLVESADDLAAGSRYVVYTYNDGNNGYIPKMMGAQKLDANGEFTKNREAIDITVNNKIISHNGQYAFRLEDAGDNLWNIKDVTNQKYINCSGKASLNLGDNSNNDSYKFSISINDNGEAIITRTNNDTTYKLQYNSAANSGNFFSFYDTNQKPICLFKETDRDESIQLANPVVTATPVDKHVTLSWDQNSNAVSYTVEWNGTDTIPNITTNSWSIDVPSAGTYTYKVKAIGNGTRYLPSNFTEGSVEVTESTNNTTQNIYALVTSTDGIVSGAEYIIVAHSPDVVLDAEGDTKKFRTTEDVTIQNNTINYTGNYSLIISVEDNNTITIYDATSGGYLNATADNSNMLKTQPLDENSYFTITVAPNGEATITASTFGRVLKYNTGSPRFSFYKTTSTGVQLVYLYKKVQ